MMEKNSMKLRHLLTIEDLSQQTLINILDKAQEYKQKNYHRYPQLDILKHKTVANLFFEPSTRTKASFELAAQRLGMKVLNFSEHTSSTQKGETLLDTFHNLQAMYCDAFVIRHSSNGMPQVLAEHAKQDVSIINAGDGSNAHPSQALLDMFTIREYKKDFSKLSVAIIGDILFSRVARSQIHALKKLNVSDIRVIAPKEFLPLDISQWGVTIYDDLQQGIRDVDVIMLLRIQRERMPATLFPNVNVYASQYGVDEQKLKFAKADAIVMHPGPINRGVEIDSNVADGSQSVILNQVENGVAIRMAIISTLVS